jgi:hypothetical protein
MILADLTDTFDVPLAGTIFNKNDNPMTLKSSILFTAPSAEFRLNPQLIEFREWFGLKSPKVSQDSSL